jgi:nicotinamidase-related amidase
MATKNPGDYTGPPVTQLEPSKTALVIVDMQYASGSRTEGMGKKRTAEGKGDSLRWRFDRIEQLVVPNTQRLLALFRESGLPIIYLTVGSEKSDFSDAPPHLVGLFRYTDNYEGSRTHEILDELKPLPGERVVNKTTYGAFASSNIKEVLEEMEVTHLLFTGVSTNVCIDATARSAADYGFNPIMIEDGMASGSEEAHRAALVAWPRPIRVSDTDEVIKELQEALALAGAPA